MCFTKNLQLLDMEPLTSGLLLVSHKNNDDISEAERRILNIAEKDYFADAVYFLKSENRNSSVPQIFIYDNTNNLLDDEKKKVIHKRIWTSEIVPLYYIFEKTQLLVVNGKQKINIEAIEENYEKTITDRLDFANLVEKQYDGLKHPYKSYFFDNGSFWDTETYQKKFISSENPFKLLIYHLKDLKNKLKGKISENLLNRLIVQCILIKYLEEKKDDNKNNIFTVKSNIFMDYWKSENFVDLIKKGHLLSLFDYLSSYYNGKIFEWNKEIEIKERKEISLLNQDILNLISEYFDGNIELKTKQISLWRFYSFQYLPVELISRIYEEFLPDKPGVVYTPPFLVDFLIDECMPIEEYSKFKGEKFKILDPSLGSGIFCVAAYKRLIDWYKINRFHNDKISWLEPIGCEILKKILRENVFGVDVEKEAVRVAIFSLTLALLENLTPLQILEELKFDDLSKDNIIQENFFSFFNKQKDNPDFDLIIGNPPFNPPDKKSNGHYFKELKNEYQIEISYKVPDDNLALIFLDRATLLSKPNGIGLTCLILPSAPLLYGKWSMDYRNHFLQQFSIPQIIDFTHLRRVLFNKDVSTVALFVKNQKPDLNANIWHIIASRTQKEQNRLFFLFDHYDFHIISYKRALNERYIWKTNLVGGGRLGRIVERLSKIDRTLKIYIKQNNWCYIRGYIVGDRTKKGDYITNKYYLPSKAFTDKGINYTKIVIEKETHFKDISQEDVFIKPQLLIKKSIYNNGIFPIELVDYNELEKSRIVKNEETKDRLCFKHGILGIHYPPKEQKIIDNLVVNIKNNILTYCFFMSLISGTLFVRKEKVIEKTDIDNLPYPENESEIKLTDIETVWRDDVLNNYIHQAKSPNRNPLNKNLKNSSKQIQNYGDIFCKVMNSSYRLKPECGFKHGESIETPSYIATCFHYTDKEIPYQFTKKNESEFKDYFNKQTGRNKQITRIVKYYHNDTIWFIKPKQVRYWLKSIADRDAFDCINDFILNKK
jgi:hypothetical protein